MNEDWIKIDLVVPKSYFVKKTEKSYCFKLWGKKFLPFPIQFMDSLDESGSEYAFTMPKWFVVKHSLKSLVVDEQKDLFPSKRELKQRQEEMKAETPPPLFTQSQPIASPFEWSGHQKLDEVVHDEVQIRQLNLDDEIPW